MTKTALRHTCACLALAAGAYGSSAFAQDQSSTPEPTDAQEREIVVTGTLIRGTPEDAALPVDVSTAEQLQAEGVTNPLEFIKDLPSSGSVLGDSNQFSTASQGFQGNGSINLRSLGSQRSLVLFNGRRFIPAPGDGFADTNLIPLFALDRVEILKDGAAATYGSDAIGGVANFITRRNWTGIQLNGDYKFVNGSEDDYNASILVGTNFGALNLIGGFGWQHRSELQARKRDFITDVPYADNPSGWSTLGNPGSYLPRAGATPVSGVTLDGNQINACNTLGGFASTTGPGAAGSPICRFTYSRSTTSSRRPTGIRPISRATST